MKKAKFFSQYGQEKFFEQKIFSNLFNGYFVDIGANDGITFSNTYFFEKKGWSGLCVEPIPEVFKKLTETRSCECICGVVSDNKGEYSEFLHVTGGPEMLSGIVDKLDSRSIDRINKEMNNKEKKEIIKVKNYNFNEIVKNKNIDFLSIDVEGAEYDILKTINFSDFEIKTISIENAFGEKQIRNLLKKNNFEFLRTIGPDELFINKNYKYLIRNKIVMKCNLIFWNFFKKTKKIIKKIIKK